MKAVTKILRRYRSPIQIAFGAIATACLVWAVVENRHDLVHALGAMDPFLIAIAVVLAYLGTVANMLSWRAIVRSFRHEVPLTGAGRVTFTAQIGKYIPGGVWPMVAGSQLGERIGLGGTTMVVTMTLQLAISLLTGSVIAVGTLFLVPGLAQSYWWAIVLTLCVGVVALLPPVMQRLLGRLFRLIRRPDLLPALHGRHLGRAILWAIVAWVLLGVQLWLLLCALGTFRWTVLLPAISGYALSWVAGFLAVFAPAGAGVREGILVLLFAGTFGGPAVLGVALVSRMAFVLVDFTLFLWAAAGLRHGRIGQAVQPALGDEKT